MMSQSSTIVRIVCDMRADIAMMASRFAEPRGSDRVDTGQGHNLSQAPVDIIAHFLPVLPVSPVSSGSVGSWWKWKFLVGGSKRDTGSGP